MTAKTKTIHHAILATQQAAPSITKDAANPFFKSKYADLPAIWASIRDIMGENGLYVSHTLDANETGDFIITKLVYAETGETIESKSRITLQKVTAQEYGSYITYMRRYALSAMLGLVTDDDDDGNAASQAKPKQQPKPAEKPKQTPEQEMAQKIAKQLKEADTPEIIEYVWKGFADQREEIKKVSDKAHKALEDIYKERMAQTSQAPIGGGND